jgi:DHA1 family tetracycline resistance protein-like MFS transporter
MTTRTNRLALASVFFTFFVDNLCWSIVFPIFAPYFLDPNNQLFGPDVLLATRTTILGLFLMAFSLGQFFGAPVLGEFADRHGRKSALAISVFFTVIGLGLSAWSMQVGNLWLLFISRLVTGIFAGNLSICLACVTDLSPDEKSKVKHFGTMSFLAGLAFVGGAFAGGKCSDPTISSWFTPYFPLWIATVLTVLNFLFILFAFRETAHVDPHVKYNWLEGFTNLQKALKTEKIKRIYTIYFFFLFSWTLLFQFTPVLVVEKFAFTSTNIGDLAIFMGLCWAIGAGYLNKMLLRRFPPFAVLEVCLLCFTVLCGLVIFPKHLWGAMVIVGCCVTLGGLSWPLCTNLISNLAPRQVQGKILGMSQSVQSLAMAIAPVIGGIAYHAKPGLPFLIGAGTSLIASIIYFTAVKE